MHKLKSLLVFQVFLSSTIVFSQDLGQKVVFEKEIKLKGKGQCLFVPFEDSVSLLIIDSEFLRVVDLEKNEIVRNYSQKGMHNIKIIGHAYSDGLSVFYSRPKNEIGYMFLSASRKEIIKGTLNYENQRDEFELSRFSSKGKFYILTVNKKSSILNFYVFSSFYQFEKRSVDLSSDFFGNPLSEELKDETTTPGNLNLIRGPYLSLIDDLMDLKISETNSLNKIYAFDEKVLITMDGSSHSTKMIEISLNDFSFRRKSFSQSGFCYSSSLYTVNNSNSFISKNKIYTVRACKEELLVGIFSLDGSVLERLEITQDDIKSTRERNFYLENPEDAKRTLRIMSKLDAGLVAQEDDSTLLLTVGGYKNYNNIGVGGFNGAPTMMVSQARSASFKGILDLYNRNKELRIDDSNYYKLGVRKRGLEYAFARYICTFTYGDQIYIAHYNKSEKSFVVEVFD